MSASAASGQLGVTGGHRQDVTTDIPGPARPAALEPLALLVIVALGITWILDGLEVTLVGSISGVLTDKGTLHLSTAQATAAGSFYLAGAVRRRAPLRLPDRPLRAQEALHDHARRLPRLHGRDGARLELLVVHDLPRPRRRRHRRRVLGDQLGDRRARARARARPGRARDQQLVVDRHGGRGRADRRCS